MTCFVVLLSDELDTAALRGVEFAIEVAGGAIESLRVLSEQPAAAELTVSGLGAETARAAVGQAIACLGIDLCVEDSVDGVRPARKLLLMDVDSTLVAGEVIDSLAAYAGMSAEVAAVTERAMRGELDFAESLHARVATLAGVPEQALAEVGGALQLSPGARTMIATLQHRGCLVGAVSGGFSQILEPLADELGLDFAAANLLEVVDGVLTGRVVGDVVDRAMKATHLGRLADINGFDRAQTVAVGDGANDLDMIAAAGVGIAYHAKPVVQAEAPVTLNHTGLDGVLLLLGIAPEDWTDGES